MSGAPARFAAILAAVLLAAPVAAQPVTGVVVDARTGEPVEQAEVVLLDADLTPVATLSVGLEGRWGVDASGAAGVRRVGVSAPGYAAWLSEELDAGERGLRIRLVRLGDTPPPPAVEVTAAEVASWCGAGLDPDAHGVVVGRVVDRATGEGLAGVETVAEWGEADTPRLTIGARAGPPYRVTTTGDDGLFLFCDLPGGEEVAVRTRVGDVPGDTARLALRAGSVHRADLSLALVRPGEPAGLFGTVVDARTGEPMAGVRVQLADAPPVSTNDRGFFSVDVAPTGLQLATFHMLGYTSRDVPVVLQPGQAGEVRVEMAEGAVELPPLTVTVRSVSRLRDIRMFEHRRAMGFGTFFTLDDLERRNPWALADVVRDTPGVHLRQFGGPLGPILVRSRGKVCSPYVWVDGLRWRGGNPMTEILGLELEAVEVHKGIPPAEFYTVGSEDCITVVAWTKRGR